MLFSQAGQHCKKYFIQIAKKRQVIWIERKLHTHQLKPGKKYFAYAYQQQATRKWKLCKAGMWYDFLELVTLVINKDRTPPYPPPPSQVYWNNIYWLADLVAILENPVLIWTQAWLNIFSFFFISLFYVGYHVQIWSCDPLFNTEHRVVWQDSIWLMIAFYFWVWMIFIRP